MTSLRDEAEELKPCLCEDSDGTTDSLRLHRHSKSLFIKATKRWAIYSLFHYVACVFCGSLGRSEPTEDEAIAAWNQRKEKA